MIWEFYQTEGKHGIHFTGYDVQMNGYSRNYVFCNEPKKQRICHCKGCGIKIPREVPRIKLVGSYYYGAGRYCMTCGKKEIARKKAEYEQVIDRLNAQITSIDGITEVADEVIDNEFYEKKMALGKMLQVMAEKGGESY